MVISVHSVCFHNIEKRWREKKTVNKWPSMLIAETCADISYQLKKTVVTARRDVLFVLDEDSGCGCMKGTEARECSFDSRRTDKNSTIWYSETGM